MNNTKENVKELFELLNSLDIKYDKVEHKEVFTCEQAEFVKGLINGQGCKNLFLKNNKKQYFLYVLPDDARADIKAVSKENSLGHLSFANEEELSEILHLKKGSVTPLGFINDTNHVVELLIDNRLKDKKLLFHPNTNTATISIEFNDFIRFLNYETNKYIFV